jgi:hypothetical protein
MISQLLDPNFMKDRVTDLGRTLKRRSTDFPRANAHVHAQAEAAGVGAAEIAAACELISNLAKTADFARKQNEAAWLPRDPYLGILQSALEEFYRKAGAVDEPDARQLHRTIDPVTDRSLKPDWIPSRNKPFMRQAEESDVLRWGLSFAVAKAIAGMRGKAPFADQVDTVPFGRTARLILVGDWASGVTRALKVAKQIAKQLPQVEDCDCHLIHLGDVYYAGRSFEYGLHVGRPWPVNQADAARIGSWCLNGNHDMFTGGHDLFAFLRNDFRFKRQKGCTYFALENDDWLIFGLDTAYTAGGMTGDLGGLTPSQADFVRRHVDRAVDKKVILLSHHQPFSAWESESPQLLDALDPLLKRPRPVEAWFWGHEHRCAVYEPSHNINYPALIGHGGVPVYASSAAPKGPKLRYYDRRSFTRGIEKYSFMGFVVIDLNGPSATARYIDEEGVEHLGRDTIG